MQTKIGTCFWHNGIVLGPTIIFFFLRIQLNNRRRNTIEGEKIRKQKKSATRYAIVLEEKERYVLSGFFFNPSNIKHQRMDLKNCHDAIVYKKICQRFLRFLRQKHRRKNVNWVPEVLLLARLRSPRIPWEHTNDLCWTSGEPQSTRKKEGISWLLSWNVNESSRVAGKVEVGDPMISTALGRCWCMLISC